MKSKAKKNKAAHLPRSTGTGELERPPRKPREPAGQRRRCAFTAAAVGIRHEQMTCIHQSASRNVRVLFE